MNSYKMRSTPRWRCPICGGAKDAKATNCSTCNKQIRCEDIPSPEMIRRVLDLYSWNYCAAGRYFRVADNTVRKWCKRFNIERTS